MTINPVLLKVLKDNGCETEGIIYLLCLFHKLPDVETLISEKTIRQVNSMSIVERDYKTKTLQWSIPLYEGQNIDDVWSWVNDYRQLFASKNKEREGNKRSCVSRMKEFFKQNPSIRKDDVLQATAMYMKTVEPTYCKMAEKFIYDGSGAFKTSQLLHWCEMVQERKEKQSIDPNIKMMK